MKAFASDKISISENLEFVLERVENIREKEENDDIRSRWHRLFILPEVQKRTWLCIQENEEDADLAFLAHLSTKSSESYCDCAVSVVRCASCVVNFLPCVCSRGHIFSPKLSKKCLA